MISGPLWCLGKVCALCHVASWRSPVFLGLFQSERASRSPRLTHLTTGAADSEREDCPTTVRAAAVGVGEAGHRLVTGQTSGQKRVPANKLENWRRNLTGDSCPIPASDLSVHTPVTGGRTEGQGREVPIIEELKVSRPDLCHELAVWPWQSHLTSLGFRLTVDKMGVTDPLFIYWVCIGNQLWCQAPAWKLGTFWGAR